MVIDAHMPISTLHEGRLYGRIYGDKKKRFADGESIITSKVESLKWTKQGVVAITRNSTYLCMEVKVEV